MSTPLIYTVSSAAVSLGVAEATVRDLCAQMQIRAGKFGRGKKILISAQQVEQMRQRDRTPARRTGPKGPRPGEGYMKRGNRGDL
jgi:excisionase family DNA binding protein